MIDYGKSRSTTLQNASSKAKRAALEKFVKQDAKLFGELVKGMFELTFAPLTILAPKKKKKRRSTRRRKKR